MIVDFVESSLDLSFVNTRYLDKISIRSIQTLVTNPLQTTITVTILPFQCTIVTKYKSTKPTMVLTIKKRK